MHAAIIATEYHYCDMATELYSLIGGSGRIIQWLATEKYVGLRHNSISNTAPNYVSCSNWHLGDWHGNKCDHQSQAARQGLAVLMASTFVVLKHKTLTLRQSHNFISIDSTFGVGDYFREFTRPAKFGSDPMSGRGATWGNMYGSCDLFFCFFSVCFLFFIMLQ